MQPTLLHVEKQTLRRCSRAWFQVFLYSQPQVVRSGFAQVCFVEEVDEQQQITEDDPAANDTRGDCTGATSHVREICGEPIIRSILVTYREVICQKGGKIKVL